MSTTTFDGARADYRTWLRWFFSGIPLLFTVVAVLAWRDPGPFGGPQWLVFVVGLPLVAAWVLWRTRDAAVTVTPAGRVRRRSVTGDQAAELSRLAEVMVLPSLSYEDQLGATQHQPDYGYLIRDLDGREVAIARGRPWTDTTPVLPRWHGRYRRARGGATR